MSSLSSLFIVRVQTESFLCLPVAYLFGVCELQILSLQPILMKALLTFSFLTTLFIHPFLLGSLTSHPPTAKEWKDVLDIVLTSPFVSFFWILGPQILDALMPWFFDVFEPILFVFLVEKFIHIF